MNLIDIWKSFWLGEDYAVAEVLSGKSDVTISSRVAKARMAGKWWGIWGCKALNVLFQAEDHCGGALQHDAERARAALKELEDEQAGQQDVCSGSVGSADSPAGGSVEQLPAGPPN